MHPVGVGVDHVGRNAALAKPVDRIVERTPVLVVETRYPQAEAPQRRHRRAACQIGIGSQNVARRRPVYQQEIENRALHRGDVGQDRQGRVGDVVADMRRGVEQHAEAAGGDEERHVLVGKLRRRAAGIGVGALDRQPELVETAEFLAQAQEMLGRVHLERGCRPVDRVPFHAEGEDPVTPLLIDVFEAGPPQHRAVFAADHDAEDIQADRCRHAAAPHRNPVRAVFAGRRQPRRQLKSRHGRGRFRVADADAHDASAVKRDRARHPPPRGQLNSHRDAAADRRRVHRADGRIVAGEHGLKRHRWLPTAI